MAEKEGLGVKLQGLGFTFAGFGEKRIKADVCIVVGVWGC